MGLATGGEHLNDVDWGRGMIRHRRFVQKDKLALIKQTIFFSNVIWR